MGSVHVCVHVTIVKVYVRSYTYMYTYTCITAISAFLPPEQGLIYMYITQYGSTVYIGMALV